MWYLRRKKVFYFISIFFKILNSYHFNQITNWLQMVSGNITTWNSMDCYKFVCVVFTLDDHWLWYYHWWMVIFSMTDHYIWNFNEVYFIDESSSKIFFCCRLIESLASDRWRWKNLNPSSGKNILIQGSRFIQLQQTRVIDYSSPIPITVIIFLPYL